MLNIIMAIIIYTHSKIIAIYQVVNLLTVRGFVISF